jgi:hypothetical protein
LAVGDVVFRTVGWGTLSHLLTTIRQIKDGVWRYPISNTHGHVNGRTTPEKNYGKGIEIRPAVGRKTE